MSRLEAVAAEAVQMPVALKTQAGVEVAEHYLATSQPERTGRLRRRNGKIEHLPRLQLIS